MSSDFPRFIACPPMKPIRMPRIGTILLLPNMVHNWWDWLLMNYWVNIKLSSNPWVKIFQNLKCIGGATILGSGEVGLIIDVPALAALCFRTTEKHIFAKTGLLMSKNIVFIETMLIRHKVYSLFQMTWFFLP